jgi:hypothetical protein
MAINRKGVRGLAVGVIAGTVFGSGVTIAYENGIAKPFETESARAQTAAALAQRQDISELIIGSSLDENGKCLLPVALRTSPGVVQAGWKNNLADTKGLLNNGRLEYNRCGSHTELNDLTYVMEATNPLDDTSTGSDTHWVGIPVNELSLLDAQALGVDKEDSLKAGQSTIWVAKPYTTEVE